jgi:site-specific DNA-methyltransferase (adenine-specific)
VTSPPYFNLRKYSADSKEIGQENSPEKYIEKLVEVFREVRRVLKPTGTLWLNLGDSYIDKNRLLMPARVALALQNDGYILRDEIIWSKPRTTPTPVKDRTCAAHEFIYMFSKNPKYYYDYLAIEEPAKYAGVVKDYTAGTQKNVGNVNKAPGSIARKIVVRDTRRKRSVWSISPQPFKGAHFACYPENLIIPCIQAGCPENGIVLDPFGGAGTTGIAARNLNRRSHLIELNPEYAEIMKQRFQDHFKD